MKRTVAVALLALLLFACAGGKSAKDIADLQKSNEDLARRVKTLENDLLEADKKLIQHQQALQAMHERLREVETSINKIALGPAR